MADAERAEVLRHLRQSAWVKLAASPIEGVGVVAIRDIPKDTNPFAACNVHKRQAEAFVTITAAELAQLEPPVRALVRSFFAPLDDALSEARPDVPRDPATLLYGVNATGVHTLDISWFLNHSDAPSVKFVEAEAAGGFNGYATTRDVRAGEELTVDYKELGIEYYLTATEGDDGPDKDVDERVRRLEEALAGARERKQRAADEEARILAALRRLRGASAPAEEAAPA